MNTTLSEKQVHILQNNQFLIGYHMVFLGILCTLSVILILFSTRYQRRIYLLALQVFALAIVIVTELMLTVHTYKACSNLLHQRPNDDPQVLALQPLGVAIDSFVSFAPLFADAVLMYRVYDIHSGPLKPKRLQRYRPLLPLIVLLVARVGLNAASIHADWVQSLDGWSLEESDKLFHNWLRLRLAEWSLQILYCSYAFVTIMRQILRMTRGSNLLHRSTNSRTKSRLRFLLEAVFMTFFIPLVFQIGALITMAAIYVEPDSAVLSNAWNRFTQLNYLFSAIFCILATSWSTIREAGGTVLGRSTKDSSLDNMVGLQVLQSKAGVESAEEGQVQSQARDRRHQSTLLDILFAGPSGGDEEAVEELRTTQFCVTEQGKQVQYRQRSNTSSDGPTTPAVEQPRP